MFATRVARASCLGKVVSIRASGDRVSREGAKEAKGWKGRNHGLGLAAASVTCTPVTQVGSLRQGSGSWCTNGFSGFLLTFKPLHLLRSFAGHSVLHPHGCHRIRGPAGRC